MLTNIMIYWITQTIDSSFFPYYDLANAGPLRWISETLVCDVPAIRARRR
jgi:hypothetical protein